MVNSEHNVVTAQERIQDLVKGGPKFFLAYIANVGKLSHMSEASTSWPGVRGLP